MIETGTVTHNGTTIHVGLEGSNTGHLEIHISSPGHSSSIFIDNGFDERFLEEMAKLFNVLADSARTYREE